MSWDEFLLYTAGGFEVLTDETFRQIALISGHDTQRFSTIGCHLNDSVPQRNLYFNIAA